MVDMATNRWRANMYNNHVDLFYYRQCRLQAVQARRLQNAIARSRGFRNFKEMAGDE